MMNQTLGLSKTRAIDCEYLTLSFSPLSAPLHSRWRNNGLSADFLADYVITFLPNEAGLPVVDGWQNEIKHAVTYIANELLENAMKYHERHIDIPICIFLELTSEQITVRASNGVGQEQAQRYRTFVEQLIQEDADELLVRQQEANAKCIDSSASCLGLLTMISHYGARLGWSFDVHPTQAQMLTVTTSAVLALNQTPGASA